MSILFICDTFILTSGNALSAGKDKDGISIPTDVVIEYFNHLKNLSEPLRCHYCLQDMICWRIPTLLQFYFNKRKYFTYKHGKSIIVKKDSNYLSETLCIVFSKCLYNKSLSPSVLYMVKILFLSPRTDSYALKIYGNKKTAKLRFMLLLIHGNSFAEYFPIPVICTWLMSYIIEKSVFGSRIPAGI